MRPNPKIFVFVCFVFMFVVNMIDHITPKMIHTTDGCHRVRWAGARSLIVMCPCILWYMDLLSWVNMWMGMMDGR